MGGSSAALDARLLLQAATGMPHERLIADPDLVIETKAAAAYRDALTRRERGEPVARIHGEREFYGRTFAVTPATLDPRPDTETLVDEALGRISHDAPFRVLDLGTGTGAILITILAERPHAHGIGSDISAGALAVARRNAERHGVAARMELVQADWLTGIEGAFDLIISNPPYIPTAAIPGLAVDVRDFEPHGALDGGADGLDAYRAIAAEARGHLGREGTVLVEIGEGQAPDVEEVFARLGYEVTTRLGDLAGRMRCLGFR